MQALGIITSRQLAVELVALIDFLSYPLNQVRDPLKWTGAYRDIHHLVTNDEIWALIWEVDEGRKSNHVIHALGANRVKWLLRFKEGIAS